MVKQRIALEHRREARARIAAYKDDGNRVLHAMGESIHNGSDPLTVAKVVLKAATARRPAVRYTAGFGSSVLKVGRRVLPTGVVHRVVRKAVGLD